MAAGFVEHAAIIAGEPAVMIDTLMARFLPRYLATMSPRQRAEMDTAHRAIRRAANAHQATSSDDGPSEPSTSDLAEDLSRENRIGTAKAADMLKVGQRQVCKLATVWEAEGLAERVGRMWLIDRDVVVAYQDRPERRRA
jgi:hypothetical protein